ncbi:hypothetical protein GGS26DRAFT_550586 [Hypomontagnella submonticulosa]|nr:hypothetical protein GGS26DRAFT_550586 [Hypomontagnella submonticulosa]
MLTSAFITGIPALASLVSATALYPRTCNPAGIQEGPFKLATFDPATNKSTGLTIGVASRAARILVPTVDGSLEGAYNFTFDNDVGRLFAPGVGYSDEALEGFTLTFNVSGLAGEAGRLAQKAVQGCFEGASTPMFLVLGDAGMSDEAALRGWNTCNMAGLFWTGDKVPDQNCTKVGVQILLLDAVEELLGR